MARAMYMVQAALLVLVVGCASAPPEAPPVTAARVSEDDERGVSLLQLAAEVKEHHSGDASAAGRQPDSTEEQLGSLVPDNGHVCYQGTMANLERQLALLRSAPVAVMHQRNSVQAQTCAQRGYGFLRHDPDDCWVWNQKWLREEHGDQELDIWGNSQAIEWQRFDAFNGFPPGTALEWCGCLCPEGSHVRTTPHFTEAYCSALIASYGQAAASIAAAAPPAVPAPAQAVTAPEEQLGSLVPDNGHVCYQGTVANLERQLALLRAAPVATLHQSNSVQTQTCAERGYGFLRHEPDDCWVWNQKWLREQHGEQELDLWADSQRITWANWDARHGFPMGTALEWCGCICPQGSSVRTTPRFTEEYCAALLASYRTALP